MHCHPERSEGSAFRKRAGEKQIPRPIQKANGARNDKSGLFLQPLQSYRTTPEIQGFQPLRARSADQNICNVGSTS